MGPAPADAGGKEERMRRWIASILFVWLALGCGIAPGQDFVVGNLRTPRGETRSGLLPVPDKEGVGTSIPMTVIHGAKKGKVLALVAGVHGAEYPPVLATYRLKSLIDPKALAGTVLLVHIANLPSYQRRTIYFNPFDWKNLNRVFPGDPNGTLSQRIAHVLTTEIVDRCDALVDMHCGDANEALIPYSYWMVSGREAMDQQTKDLTLAFGLRHNIIDTEKPKDARESKYLSTTAVLRGKPAVTTEAGYLGRSDEADIARNVDGALSVLRFYKMIPGRPAPAADPVWIDKYEVVNSNTDGVFTPKAAMGDAVAEGQVVGIVADYLGTVREELKAPFAGILLYIIGTPPTNKGEPLFEVGRIKK
jgi:predicted deacylase